MSATMPPNLHEPAALQAAEPARADAAERLVRLPEVLRTLSLGRTAWLDLVKAGKAPASIKIGRATFWQASEIQAFIAERVRQSRAKR